MGLNKPAHGSRVSRVHAVTCKRTEPDDLFAGRARAVILCDDESLLIRGVVGIGLGRSAYIGLDETSHNKAVGRWHND